MHEVLVCGSNGNGQLGLGHLEDTSNPETCFCTDDDIVDISNGGNHTLILLRSGDVYASGVKKAYFNPTIDHITKFEKVCVDIKFIGTGWDFSVVVTISDEVVLMNSEGRTLMGRLHTDVHDPIKQLRTSLNAVIVIYESGKAYCWGDNKKGQLQGDTDCTKIVSDPTKISFDDIQGINDSKLTDVSMSRYFNLFIFERIDAQKEKIVVLRCKADNYKMITNLEDVFDCKVIGDVGINRSLVFHINNNVHVSHFESMWSSLHMLISGNIISTGNNVYGQLYNGDNEEISRFTTGTEHGLTVNKLSTEVKAWGWGEHGNCGGILGSEDRGELRSLYKCNEMEQVHSIYGGYANSWIVLQK